MSRLEQESGGARGQGRAGGGSVAHDRALARTYLGGLRQLVAMIERLPADPGLRAAILAWRPESYQDFAARSGSTGAPGEPTRFDPVLRRSFEAIVAAFARLAADAVGQIARTPGLGEPSLEAPLLTMRVLLDRAATLVEDGDTLAADAAGRRANRFYAR